jgi:putative sterol carrier protein
MRWVISEEQNENFANSLEKYLIKKFSNNDYLCEIKVYVNDDESKEFWNNFDIHIILNERKLIDLNSGQMRNLSVSLENKIHILLQEDFNFSSWYENYFIYTKKCL